MKGTESTLSRVQCFLYLVSSSINVSSFHFTWLDTFWTDLIYICVYVWGYIYVCVHVCVYSLCHIEEGCSQEEGPKKGFVMGSRTRGVQEILERCI